VLDRVGRGRGVGIGRTGCRLYKAGDHVVCGVIVDFCLKMHCDDLEYLGEHTILLDTFTANMSQSTKVVPRCTSDAL
jgi:hypothetical protein